MCVVVTAVRGSDLRNQRGAVRIRDIHNVQAAAHVAGKIADSVGYLDVFHVDWPRGAVIESQDRCVRVGDVVNQHAIAPFRAEVGEVAVAPHSGVGLETVIGVDV